MRKVFEKDFTFEFPGTKDDFRKRLWKAANDDLDEIYGDHSEYSIYDESTDFYDREHFHFKDYIVEFVDDEIRFGVEREGHGGGVWFVPSITEHDGKVVFNGKVQSARQKMQSPDNSNRIDRIKEWLLFIIMLPFVLIFVAVVLLDVFLDRLLKRIKGIPTPKEKSTEGKLMDLMENYLGCIRK